MNESIVESKFATSEPAGLCECECDDEDDDEDDEDCRFWSERSIRSAILAERLS